MGINNITAVGMYKMCIRKKRYKTLKLAEKFARILTQKYGVEQVPYWCPLCGNYHLTTHPQVKKV